MNEEKKFIKLTPFKMQILQSFPFIDEDFDAITNYELLCKVVDYLNKTVENVDYLNDTVNDYIDKFNELKSYVDNYFDNLDVQEEINNKLDEMADSGELTDIIAQYLGLAGMITFNNVSEMKLAENLVNGSKCQTLGFYNTNDFGGACYKVRTITNEDTIDEKTIIALSNINLIAELIKEDKMNVNQFGAYGNGITDDSLSIQTAINNCNYITFPSANYVCKEIEINSNKIIDGLNNNIIMVDDTKLFTNNYDSENTNNNIIIKNFNIICDDVSGDDEKNNVIYLCGVENTKIENVNILNSNSDGIYIGSYNYNKTNKNVEINNCKIKDSERNNISIICGDVKINNCYFDGGTISSIDIEPNLQNENSNVIISNSIIDNGFINGYAKSEIRSYVKLDLTIKNCVFNNTSRSLFIEYMNNIDVENNIFNNTSSDLQIIDLYESKNCKVNNNVIYGNDSISGIKNGSCNNSLINNNIINDCKYAIEILNSSHCHISNNECLNNKTMGIYNRGTTARNIYNGNTIINGTNAIYTDTGTYEQIINNNTSSTNSSTTRSIVCATNTSKILIANNIISNFSEYAVRDSGTDNVQANNIIN